MPCPADSAWSGTQGLYRRTLRPLFGAVLVALITPPVAALVALIAAAQLVVSPRLRDVFFVQWRVGRHGQPFRILKFRTLEPDGEDGLRATPLGRTLRRTHLDELPQLWNVLRGQMSLIGPRPETLELEEWAEEAIPGFGERLELHPGITGLAQVEQDSVPQDLAAYEEKLRLNMEYSAAMCLRMDLYILLQTAIRPLLPKTPFRRTPGQARAGVLLPGPTKSDRDAA